MSIQRGPHLLFPEGDTVLEPGDVVSVLSRPEHAGPLRTCLRGPDADPKEESRPGPDMI